MNSTQFLHKHRNTIPHLIIVVLAIIIASNIYKSQKLALAKIRAVNETELKKNRVLGSISKEKRKTDAYGRMLKKKDASAIIASLGAIAQETNVQIESIKPLGEQTYGDFLTLPFNISIRAPNYHVLGKFVSRIESYRDFYIIESLRVQLSKQADSLQATLIVSAVMAQN